MPPGSALRVSNVSKTYRIVRREDRASSVAEATIMRLKRKKKAVETFDALSDVTFEVPWGAVVGIIGRNGAGKSTLLKIINRITAPTTGRLELGGRVGSLLEVGTGFHPELTGRENIYLNGTLLGMRRREIRKQFDTIVEFAGTEQFLDTQVKRYSTGMYIRLAFAVAAHLDSEILVVDEVLAVGDSDFQAKCLRKMRDVARDGRTVLVVSHQLQTISDLCNAALYLDRGQLVLYGTVENAMTEYKQSFSRNASIPVDAANRPGTGEIRFMDASVANDFQRPGSEVTVSFSIGANPSHHNRYHVTSFLSNEDGLVIAQCDSRVMDFWLDPDADAEIQLRLKTPWLKPGTYTVGLFIMSGGRATDIWEQACQFQVLPISPYPHATTPDGTDRGVIFPEFEYSQI
jgi:lipopolysaccharide transport system ATP-binding protein